jgi:hypothetical protein
MQQHHMTHKSVEQKNQSAVQVEAVHAHILSAGLCTEALAALLHHDYVRCNLVKRDSSPVQTDAVHVHALSTGHSSEVSSEALAALLQHDM